MIEFKYYPTPNLKAQDTLTDFQQQAEDTQQITGYSLRLQQEFPRAHIERYVIYCIGNQGFRVFAVTTPAVPLK